MKEICICAAIKLSNGKIIRGHRHSDCFYTVRRMVKEKEDTSIDTAMGANGDQGFMTSKNRFVSREEGRKLQDAAGIKSASPEGYVADTLFSEDLY